MKNSEINLLIINKLLEKDYSIVNIEGNYITAIGKNGIEFNISYEMCVCHGGRLSIDCKHIDFYKRLESDSYDEELGITDSESELLYYINNKMFEVINSFEKYIYKVVEQKPGYYKDKDEISYYDNTKEIARRICNEKDKDIFAIEEKILTYPNENTIEKIENISLNNGKLEFDKFRYNRKDKNSEFIRDESDYSLKHYIVSVIDKRRN